MEQVGRSVVMLLCAAVRKVCWGDGMEW